MNKKTKRRNDQLRPIEFIHGFTKHAAGSVLVKWGDTWVLCTASVEDRVPPFLKDTGKGWVTAEYSMLPSSTGGGRKERDIKKLKQDARSTEIQRLIGRSLRAAVDISKLGERQITIDCDVLQADGGTRCASITGGMAALEDAVAKLMKEGRLAENPIIHRVAAVSVGVCDGKPTLDLDYVHDSTAEVDLNVVMTDDGRYVELQGTAEHKPFTEESLDALRSLARKGLKHIFSMMKPVKLMALIALALCAGCRILETGYGDDNAVVRGASDAVSSTVGVARSTVSWAGATVLSFADDLTPDLHRHFITMGEHAAAAYRNHPDLPDGFRPLSQDEFNSLALPADRYRFEPETGYVEDAGGVGFGARLSRNKESSDIVVAFRGSNAPGEDAHWMQDWIDDAHQGGGGTPVQYTYGAEVLSAVRSVFPDTHISVTGHSLGGGIAAFSTIGLDGAKNLACTTYNAAGISSITLLSMPKETLEKVSTQIVNIRSKGDPVSAIPGTQLVGNIYEVDNLRFANHSIDGLLIDMRRRAEGRRAGWLRDLFDD